MKLCFCVGLIFCQGWIAQRLQGSLKRSTIPTKVNKHSPIHWPDASYTSKSSDQRTPSPTNIGSFVVMILPCALRIYHQDLSVLTPGRRYCFGFRFCRFGSALLEAWRDLSFRDRPFEGDLDSRSRVPFSCLRFELGRLFSRFSGREDFPGLWTFCALRILGFERSFRWLFWAIEADSFGFWPATMLLLCDPVNFWL